MKIYVASSWRNPHQPRVVATLREAGHEVYDFKNPPHGQGGFHWSAIDPDWQKWTPEAYRKHLQGSPVAGHGFNSDFRAMRWADACVLVLPCGSSAHLEAGWFTGAGKRTVILMEELKEPELMYLQADHLCTSVEEVLLALGETSQFKISALLTSQ